MKIDLNKPPAPGRIFFDVVSGVHGPALCVGDEGSGYRIAGPKPWGGGATKYRFSVDTKELAQQLHVDDAGLKLLDARAILERATALLVEANDEIHRARRSSIEYRQQLEERVLQLKDDVQSLARSIVPGPHGQALEALLHAADDVQKHSVATESRRRALRSAVQRMRIALTPDTETTARE